MKPILPNVDAINSIISFAKKCFTKPQFKQVKTYLTGLITLPKKSISSISAASVRKQNQSSLNKFLTTSNWNEQKLENRYMKKVHHIFGRWKATLVIDDSLAKKTGKHIEETQYHKDHSGKGYVFGHQIITALVKVKEKAFPLFPKLYSKKTCSKIEFAKELITYSTSKLRLKEAVIDSWYTSTEIVKLCVKKGLDVIGCIKSNRSVSLKPGEWVKLSSFRKKLKPKNFQTVIIDDATYRVYEKVVRLKHIGFVKLLITQQRNEEKKRWSRTFYLISTNMEKSVVQVLRTYAQRWSIEVFHKDIKQNLGLEAYQVRGREGIIRHLILVVLAYAVLKLWMYFNNVVWSIGEAIRYI